MNTQETAETSRSPEQTNILNLKDHECDEHCDHSNLTFSDLMGDPKRGEDEKFEEYRKRLALQNKARRRYLHGRTIWDSMQRGEARNPMRKYRNSKKRLQKDEYNDRISFICSLQGKRTAEEVQCRNRERKQIFMEACRKRHEQNGSN